MPAPSSEGFGAPWSRAAQPENPAGLKQSPTRKSAPTRAEVKERLAETFAVEDEDQDAVIYSARVGLTADLLPDVLRLHVPKGSTIDVLPIAGGIGNPKLLQAGEAELALAMSVPARWACRGEVAFEGGRDAFARRMLETTGTTPGLSVAVVQGDRIVYTDIEVKRKDVKGEEFSVPTIEREDDSSAEGTETVVLKIACLPESEVEERIARGLGPVTPDGDMREERFRLVVEGPPNWTDFRAFWKLFGGRLPIIGTGGVCSGSDAFEHFLCGATAVQVGTTLVEEGMGIFERLEHELASLLEKKGYASVLSCRGKLKEL